MSFRRTLAGTATPLSKNAVNYAGFKRLVSLVPEFEFFRMPGPACLNLLYKPVGASDSMWAPALLKVTSLEQTPDNDNRSFFHLPLSVRSQIPRWAVPCMFLNLRRKDMFVVDSSHYGNTRIPSTLALRKNGAGALDTAYVADGELSSVLVRNYASTTCDNIAGWLMALWSPTTDVHRNRRALMVALWNILYSKIGARIEYSDEAPTRHIKINQVTCLQRFVSPQPGKPLSLRVNMFKGKSPNHRPLSVDDDIDYVLVGVGDEARGLRGLFVFPKSFLVDNRYFADSCGCAGKFHLIVYPPLYASSLKEASAVDQAIMRRAEQQLSYYIDLDDQCPSSLAKARERFVEMLKI